MKLTILLALVLVAITVFFTKQAVGEYEGVGTFFDGLGTPYGGCGIPEGNLESPHYVALNVQNTPQDYETYFKRPFSDIPAIGAWNNGLNCGRWVRVKIGDYCLGAANGGLPGTGICEGGQWISDEFNGATLDMLVTDSCQDGNVWCRDSQYHLDLRTSSLPHFMKEGQPIGDAIFQKWNNRMLSWEYVPAANYQGDISIGFRENAHRDWFPAIAIANLPNGIHGVQRYVNGQWVNASMIGDNGQAFHLPGADGSFRIRIIDATDELQFDGRIYEFEFPSSCTERCAGAFTPVAYKTYEKYDKLFSYSHHIRRAATTLL